MIRKEDVSDIQPLTPMQEGMLFHHLLGDVPTAYHEMLRIRFARAEIPRLMRAWEQLVCRYDALRRVFVADRAKTPVQMVLRCLSPDMEEEDLSALPREKREAVLLEKISGLCRQNFSLEEKPPFFLRFFSMGELGCEMILVFHHILLDGWSLGLVLEDLFALYRGEAVESLPAVPDMRHYHGWRARCDDAAAKAYWDSRLKGWEGSADLPFFKESGKDGHPFRPEVLPLNFTAQETEKFKALAARLEVTLSALVEGIWRVLLHRYTGDTDAVFGRVSAGRPPEVPGMERMAGLFIQTLPVRLVMDGDKPFSELCRELLDDAFRAQEHGHLSLAEIGAGSGGSASFFSHILVFENFPSPGSAEALEATSGLALKSTTFEEHSSYDLEVVVHPEPALDIAFRFNSARLGAATVQRMAAHFERALRAVLENPFQAAGHIQILDPDEWQAVLPPIPEIPEASPLLTKRLVRVAEKHPEKPLLCCGDQTLTAADFTNRARQAAAGLINLGVRPGDGVGIAMKRSKNLPAAIFGVLFAGAFWVPMDPSHPVKRNAYIRENSQCRCVVGDENGPGIKAFSSLLDQGLAPVRDWDRQSPAYRIYTSGSTGLPKGVDVSRDNLAVFAENPGPAFGFSEQDRILAQTTVTFDISILEMVVAPALGVSVAMADDAACRDPETLMELIHKKNVRIIQMTPSFLKLMMDVHEDGRPFPPHLRRILVGGEQLPDSLAKRLQALRHSNPGPGAELEIINVYGPTESTIWSTAWKLPEQPLPEGAMSVGRPLAGESVYLLSRQGQPAPLEAVGEIVVAGRGVARGYHALAEKNAAKFRENPFEPGRVYYTGDLGRRRTDGLLVCLGRMDEQVKIRGNRVEPEEVAAVFLTHPGVHDAVAGTVKSAGEKALCCWFIPQGAVSTDDLREYGRCQLPEAMVPDVFVTVDAIPLNPSGKADKKRLPLPDGGSEQSGGETMAPRETRLAAIWQEVLGTRPGSRESSFFAIGGHSLKAIQLVSRIRKHMGVNCTIRDVFAAPTLGAQALLLEKREAGEKDEFLLAPARAELPLSPGQLRMWLVESRGTHPGAYNTAGLFLLEGSPDPAAFEKAMTLMVQRHESLRTLYSLKAGQPCQHILPPFAVDIIPEPIPLPNGPDPEAEAKALKDIAHTEAHRSFDLAAGPLFRIRWITLPSREGRERAGLIMVFHHIASDGWSDGILAREISRACEAYAAGSSPELPALPLRYRDYAYTLDQWLSSRDAAACQAFWQQRLAGVKPLDLPLDFARPRLRQNQGSRHILQTTDGTGRQLEEGARAMGISLFQLLLGATALLLFNRSGETDFVVGTPSAGRWHRDLEPLVGFFLNIVPIRISFEETITGNELLQTAARCALEALSMERYPFERMVADAGLAEDPGRHPLFDVMLIVHNQEPARFALPDCSVQEMALSQPGCRFDLDFEWHTTGGGWGFLDYDAALFTPETATAMGADFLNAGLWLLENPECPVNLFFDRPGDENFAAVAMAPLSEDF